MSTINGFYFSENFGHKYETSTELPKTIHYEAGHRIEFFRIRWLDFLFIRKRLMRCVLDKRKRVLGVREFMTLPKLGEIEVIKGVLTKSKDGGYETKVLRELNE